VESVLSQTFRDLELIIVDDGSTDGTKETLAGYRQSPNVVFIERPHGGLPSARNAGLEAARGEYLAFIDADDMFMKDKIEKQARALDRSARPGAVYTRWKFFYDGDTAGAFPSGYPALSGDLFFFLKRSNFIHVSTVMLRRSALGSLRFDPSLVSHEDWDFFLKLASAGTRFACLDEPLSLVRIRATSMTASGPTMDSSREIVGRRARAMWCKLKGSISIKDAEGMRNLARYISLRARAGLLDFPDSPGFNRPLPDRR
jgi:glycosyltransferase involved in cell wall biosynthesis